MPMIVPTIAAKRNGDAEPTCCFYRSGECPADVYPSFATYVRGMSVSSVDQLERRAALLPVILEVVDVAAIVVIPAAQIDREGLDVSNIHALGQALEAVAVVGVGEPR